MLTSFYCFDRTFFKRQPERLADGADSFTDNSLLLLQCDSGDENGTMIASARYNIMEQCGADDERVAAAGRKHVVFVIHLPRKLGGCFTGFEVALSDVASLPV